MMSSRLLRHAMTSGAAVFILFSAGLASAQVAGTEGIKQGERFAKAGAESVVSLVNARHQLAATLGAYNALVTQTTKDPKGDYKRLLKNLADAKTRLMAVTPKVDLMKIEAESYFKLWAGQVANIGDADLRKRGDERIMLKRQEYEGILTGLANARASLEPFLKNMTDQINFLGSDLRPGAFAALKGDADKLNNNGMELFSRIDGTVSNSNAFFAPLRSGS